MTTSPTEERPSTAPRERTTSVAPRPPLLAMVVVGVVGLVVLGLFLRSGGLGTQSLTESLLDGDEEVVGPGEVRLDLGGAVVSADLSDPWIRRERCPGWVQLTSMDGDATRVHVIATAGAPDIATGGLVAVDDYAAWLGSEIGVVQDPSSETSMLGVPATAGPLVAPDDAPREALLAACVEDDGDVGTGIRGPAAGFDQDLVITTQPVDELGHVLVLGSAWVGGDLRVAGAEARRVATSLALVDQ